MHAHASRQRRLLLCSCLVLAAWATAPALDAGTAADQARQVVEATGVRGGLFVHVGCGDGQLAVALHAATGAVVHGLAADAKTVDAARQLVRSKGLYGPVTVTRWDTSHLPYIDNSVNLLVSDTPLGALRDEVTRVLCPNGVAYVREGGQWRKTTKAWPKEIDEWTHYFHDATGNPVARDTVVGPPRRLQWVAGPNWARHHDHMASMTSLVSARGRLFYIFDEGPTASIQLPSQWRLIARDGFNGALLWKRDIGQWNTRQWPLKSGPAHLTRRLVAVGDRVYVTLSLEAPVVALDAATGKTLHTYTGSDRTREILVADGALLALVGLKPSRLPEWRRRHSYVWDNTRRANSE